jgi:exodeoxyribonuclease-5
MTSIIPSADQQSAHDTIGRFRAQDQERVAVVTGFAGTGKTTLIRLLSDSYGEPTVLCPTGKAALRVGEATGIFGMTIHRWLYEPSEDARTGQPVFTLKSRWDDAFKDMEGALVLIDEASMVPPDVWRDLLTMAKLVGFYIVLMGDLFQLPPVLKTDGGVPFSTLTYDTPFRVNLTEVIRQAQESPIIRASMMLRSGRPEYEAMALLDPLGSSTLIQSVIDIRARGGATICFTNQRRHDINNRVRATLGYESDTIQKGEPLLVTQNNYGLNVYNGEIIDFQGWLEDPIENQIVVTDRYTSTSLKMRFGVTGYNDCQATLSPEQVAGRCEAAKVGNWVVRKAARFWYRDDHHSEGAPPHLDANYGYGLTAHKAQGSEFDEVAVVFEPALRRLSARERARWIYTSITRAKHTTHYIYVED